MCYAMSRSGWRHRAGVKKPSIVSPKKNCPTPSSNATSGYARLVELLGCIQTCVALIGIANERRYAYLRTETTCYLEFTCTAASCITFLLRECKKGRKYLPVSVDPITWMLLVRSTLEKLEMGARISRLPLLSARCSNDAHWLTFRETCGRHSDDATGPIGAA